VRVAVEAWFDQTWRLAEEHGPRPRRLAAMALAHSATEGRLSEAVAALFEDEAAVVRAYRGLASRLEVVYEHIGEEVAASLPGDPLDAVHTDRLREVAAAVVVRSHFADA
jgi:hypothetical protein